MSDIWRFVRFAGDVSSESAHRLGKARIAAVDVMGSTDRRGSIGDQTGDDQRGPGPDVAGLNRGSGEPFDTVQHDVVTIHACVGAEARKLLHGAQARLEDVL